MSDDGRAAKTIFRRTPESAAMLASVRRAMAITARLNRLTFDDADEMAKKFHALAEGGRVTMELQDMFWGAKFGMLMDAYGIQWMFSCTKRA